VVAEFSGEFNTQWTRMVASVILFRPIFCLRSRYFDEPFNSNLGVTGVLAV
jgi:hypothetical protein